MSTDARTIFASRYGSAMPRQRARSRKARRELRQRLLLRERPARCLRGGAVLAEQRGELPDAAGLASLGCGNPTAVADLNEGEVVLDLGSGGGIDVILSAKRVGPTGIAYGLDMTDEMLALAQRNAREAGVPNVHFLKGLIEAIPLPADSVDVVISNCVINLSADKPAVLTRWRASFDPVVESGSPTSSPRIASAPRSGSSAGTSPAASPERSPWRVPGGPRGRRLRGRERHLHARDHRRDPRRNRQGAQAGRSCGERLPVVQPATSAGCC